MEEVEKKEKKEEEEEEGEEKECLPQVGRGGCRLLWPCRRSRGSCAMNKHAFAAVVCYCRAGAPKSAFAVVVCYLC